MIFFFLISQQISIPNSILYEARQKYLCFVWEVSLLFCMCSHLVGLNSFPKRQKMLGNSSVELFCADRFDAHWVRNIERFPDTGTLPSNPLWLPFDFISINSFHFECCPECDICSPHAAIRYCSKRVNCEHKFSSYIYCGGLQLYLTEIVQNRPGLQF